MLLKTANRKKQEQTTELKIKLEKIKSDYNRSLTLSSNNTTYALLEKVYLDLFYFERENRFKPGFSGEIKKECERLYQNLMIKMQKYSTKKEQISQFINCDY